MSHSKAWLAQASLQAVCMASDGMVKVSPCHWKAVNSLGKPLKNFDLETSGVKLTLCQPISLWLFFLTFPPRASAMSWAPR